ncbi:MAG: 50S ribosomal protein L21 [Bacteroidetes bacterium]|nr:MAG: 50S ribosomal protein L21 [Bacteroidota bacterium]
MYAIVNMKGQQMKVEEGAELFVNLIDAEKGDQIAFDEVLLIDSDGDVKIGTPHLKAKVNATVIEHAKGDKVIVFKKKRRKGYKVTNGHRQQFTKIKIDSITI